MKKLILSATLMLLPAAMQAQYVSEVWCPDNGDGTYTNPVLYADYSDPDACAVFFAQSVETAGLDSVLKLTRLLLISLFLCYQSAVFSAI